MVPGIRNSLFLALLAILFFSCARRPVSQLSRAHLLGQTTVESVLFRARGSDLLLFNLHANERTSVEAALSLIRRCGGQVLTIRHSGQRLITFLLTNESFTFDPNRIFTDPGAVATLARHSRSDPQALSTVRRFADELLSSYRLDSASVIVTLHNNSDAQYSALSYTSGGDLEKEAEAVYLHPGKDSDDFFLVTWREFFDFFKASSFNVVLQDNRQATDDGSLSVLAAAQGIPYINVEAQHGHRKEQEKMLRQVFRLLSQRN